MPDTGRIVRFQNRFRKLNETGKSHIEDTILQFSPINAAPSEPRQPARNKPPDKQEPALLQELPTPSGSILIKGNNTGINGITAQVNGTTLSIIEFLNQSLDAVYLDASDDILERYETLLHIENILEYDYPELVYTPAYLNTLAYEYETCPDDTSLYKAVISEYNAALKDITNNILRWADLMETWYTEISDNPAKARLDIFSR